MSSRKLLLPAQSRETGHGGEGSSCFVDKWAHSWWCEGLRVVCAFSFLPPEIQVEELLSSCSCGSSPHSRKTVPNPGKLVIIIWLSACDHVRPPFGPWARSKGTWWPWQWSGDQLLACFECVVAGFNGQLVCDIGWHGAIAGLSHTSLYTIPVWWCQTSEQPTDLGNSSAPQSILCLQSSCYSEWTSLICSRCPTI